MGQTKLGFPILSPSKLTGKFDCLIFNDVLHHVVDKQENFLRYYVNNYLRSGGLLFIKDMSPEKRFPKYFNRLQDFILARQVIKEISNEKVLSLLSSKFKLLEQGRKQIFLYNHYFMILRKISS